MARIYLASSWRNEEQPAYVARLRSEGHEVYDFRNPPTGTGFAWSEVGLDDPRPSVEAYKAALAHPRAQAALDSDFGGMRWCDTLVLLLPCGRSAHLEAGWAAGAGKRTIILLDDGEPELMNLLADELVVSTDELVALLGSMP